MMKCDCICSYMCIHICVSMYVSYVYHPSLVYISLGLISYSFHMFFDCTALLAGLIAMVIANGVPMIISQTGKQYGNLFNLLCLITVVTSEFRTEILAGFVNGLFLIFMAFFIFC